MVGITDYAFRRSVQRYLPEGENTIWPTEMLSSRRVLYQKEDERPENCLRDHEYGVHPQLLGNEKVFIQDSIKKLESWGAKGIDINMGCPVKKALKHNYGVALMGDPGYAKKVVEWAVESSTLPVSVKLRSGFDFSEQKLQKFIGGLRDAGASWITLHPRKAGQKRRGVANWDQLKTLSQSIDVPLIGNGDVQCMDDFESRFKYYPVEKIMVGRALCARPWLFWQIGEKLGMKSPRDFAGQNAPQSPIEEGAAYGKFLSFYLKELQELYGDFSKVKRRMVFLLHHGIQWLDFGLSLKKAVLKSKSIGEIENGLTTFFSQEQRMSKRTSLAQ